MKPEKFGKLSPIMQNATCSYSSVRIHPAASNLFVTLDDVTDTPTRHWNTKIIVVNIFITLFLFIITRLLITSTTTNNPIFFSFNYCFLTFFFCFLFGGFIG